MKLDQQGRDLDLLLNKYDVEVAKIWNISREAVRQIRKRNKYKKFNKYEVYAKESSESLRKNMIQYMNDYIILNLFEFKKLYKCTHYYTPRREDFHNLISELNSKNFFENDLIHSQLKYSQNKCKCEICKLCNNIIIYIRSKKLNYKYLIIGKCFLSGYLANKYINIYQDELTFKKPVFYKMIRSYLEKNENDLLEEIKSDIRNYIEF